MGRFFLKVWFKGTPRNFMRPHFFKQNV